KGERIARTMTEFCHSIDPTRPVIVASSSGPEILKGTDVAGYNYILQNPVDKHRADYPARVALGTEETSGCGTRGIYYDDVENGRMAALNRSPQGPDSLYNCIERGWQFYDARPWLAGLFYWTGFDYRGEPNPLKYPATGSEFGILDYCGFPKDEAFYLKAWWTDEPVLHILPHWNLEGHEGEKVSVWVYSNCDEVALSVNGKNLGRKRMPRNGHLEWTAVYQPGRVRAVGYRNGKKICEETVYTAAAPAALQAVADRTEIRADGQDLAVLELSVLDARSRFVPTACLPVTVTVEGPVRILGAGNGDPAFRGRERPEDPAARSFTIDTFNGLAQVLIQSTGEPGAATVHLNTGICTYSVTISAVRP
ncbi:MAG: DUF4982 domain-containing protein, partial [Bacteroidales bacterium]|nr:DUF4982 domain-containing protein [Bacteroidales bacterium]